MKYTSTPDTHPFTARFRKAYEALDISQAHLHRITGYSQAKVKMLLEGKLLPSKMCLLLAETMAAFFLLLDTSRRPAKKAK